MNSHCNAIESVALQRQANSDDNDNKIMLASDNCDGGLCSWNIPTLCDDNDENNDAESKKSKLNKNNKSKSSNIKKKQQQPMAPLQAHTTNISNTSFSNIIPNHMIASSYHFSLKLWWNLKSSSSITTCKLNNDDVATASVTNATFKPSHKGCVSDAQWSPIHVFLFATTDKHSKDDDNKELCLAFGNCNDTHEIYSAGTDCVVKQFSFWFYFFSMHLHACVE